MVEVAGDLWNSDCEWLLIPTNGIVTKQGLAVMGAGFAKQASDQYPELPQILGYFLQKKGNSPHYLGLYGSKHLFSFPTKGDWRKPSELKLIEESARKIREIWELCGSRHLVGLPKVGCGLGQLSWGVVEPMLSGIFPEDLFIVFCL